MNSELLLDPNRVGRPLRETGIYVRARDAKGKWGSHDLVWLSRDSVLQWLKSRGGDNPWAEQTVLALLGHHP